MIIIKNALIITMNPRSDLIKNGKIAIDGNTIQYVGRGDKISETKAEKVIDAGGKLVIPGLIDAHVHLLHGLVRGLSADKEVLDYMLKTAWPNYVHISPEEAYVATLLGCIESIKSGTTFVVDNSTAARERYRGVLDNLLGAIRDSGLRAIAAPGYVDFEDSYTSRFPNLLRSTDQVLGDYEYLFQQWHGKHGGRIRVWGSPHIMSSCTKESIVKVAELARSHGSGIHAHTSESLWQNRASQERFGKSCVEVFQELGVLGEKFHAVHAVWLSDNDIHLIKKSNAKIVHNPESNMILSSGVAPISRFLEEQITVALGCDACICNNNLDMIESMRFSALLQKVHTLKPNSISAWQVLKMATIGGASAMGLEDEIGSIEVGKKADIVIIDFMKPHMIPLHDPISNLVYSSNSADVNTVIVDGKILMEDRVLTFIDEQNFLAKAQAMAVDLSKRLNP